MTPLLELRDLALSLPGPGAARIRPVDGVSFSLDRGECVGLVGESGCGKSLSSMTIMGLTRGLPGARVEGQALWHGGLGPTASAPGEVDLISLSEAQMLRYRGGAIGMVFQDPLSCLNPLLRLDYQIAEVLQRHPPASGRLGGTALRARIHELLEMVGIPQPELRARQFPHQLSGGLRQRALLAIALAAEPKLLICDEPTTALDVTIQAQVLETLRRLQRERGLSILFITHDLGVIAQLCSRVLVMYAGRIVEAAPTAQFFERPLHPYSQGLLASLPGRQAVRGSVTAPGERQLYSIPGAPPRPGFFPGGCRFSPRCPHTQPACDAAYPLPEHVGERSVSCRRALELQALEPQLAGEATSPARGHP